MHRSLLLGLLALTVAACAGGPATPTATPTADPAAVPTPLSLAKADIEAEFARLPAGDAAAGKAKFSSAGCVACHSLEAGVRIVGPSMAGVATRAATAEPDLSASLYLYKSITRPDATVAEGYTLGLMPKGFRDTLAPETMADLIAFLLTLE